MFTRKMFAGLAAGALLGGGLVGLASSAVAAGDGVAPTKAPITQSRFDTTNTKPANAGDRECDGTHKQERKHARDGSGNATTKPADQAKKQNRECDGTHKQERKRDGSGNATTKPAGQQTKTKAKVNKGDCDGTQRHARHGSHHS